MSKNEKLNSYAAAVRHFADHAEALRESEEIKRAATAVGKKLEEQAMLTKPDFAKISALQSERQHLADRLFKAGTKIKTLEDTFARAGDAIYNHVNSSRAAAAEAAVECVKARLRDDFTGDALEHVVRWHPVTLAEDARAASIQSVRDLGFSFSLFAQTVPALVRQVEMSEQRISIYRTCTETRSLPDQKRLDAVTPDSAKPTKIATRRERTEEEEAQRQIELMDPETTRVRELFLKAKSIAATFNEAALSEFLSKHPEIKRFFPAAA